MSHVLMSLLLLRAFRSKSCINASARKLESGDPKDNAKYMFNCTNYPKIHWPNIKKDTDKTNRAPKRN